MVPAWQALWPTRLAGNAASSSTRLVLAKVFSFRQDALARNENCRVGQSAAGTEREQQQLQRERGRERNWKRACSMRHFSLKVSLFVVPQQASLSADKSYLDNRPSRGGAGGEECK